MKAQKNRDAAPQQYDKIGGWLILVAIGLIFAPIRLLVVLFKDLLPALSADTWSRLTTPGTEAYHPLWAPLLFFEIIGNCLFILSPIIIAVFFFQRRRFVPRLFIVLLLANLVFVTIDYFAADLIPFVAAQEDLGSLKELIRALIACAIWVPYFLVSKRVKGTFVV
ncbi:MAG: DUF2569 domain-containing protein [Deltaproteobacteria bacterium]|nr:DUF2569 domain-containing protein [Deltaproteobacteria bacterium]